MATFVLPRFLETHQTRVEHARKLEQVLREVGASVVEARPVSVAAPGDSLTLRGIPAIGRSVAGVIRGTNPETVIHRIAA